MKQTFPENPFGNCRLPPFQFPVSHKAKTITGKLSSVLSVFNGRSNWFILTNAKHPRLSLDQQSDIVSRVSPDSYASIENLSTADQLSTDICMSIEYRSRVNRGVDGVLMEGRSRASIKGINRGYRSTLDRGCLW